MTNPAKNGDFTQQNAGANLNKIVGEIEKNCKLAEHAKGSVTSIGANGTEVSFFEPVLCKECSQAIKKRIGGEK